MNNCFVNVCGGVGNQLFQIANGYAYSKKHNKEMWINPYYWNASQGKSPTDYQSTIFKNFQYWSCPNGNTKILMETIPFLELDFHIGNVSLNGYFQSLKYFKDYFEEFKNKLDLPRVKKDFIEKNNVAFHIRRGDYLLYPTIHYVCDTNYFKNMFEEFSNYQINVFTDSPNYVLDEFKDFKFNLIQTSSELNDLTLMSQHDNMVCSNSSFSWWASVLGKQKDKVIVPNRWFNDRDFEDIYLPNMIRI